MASASNLPLSSEFPSCTCNSFSSLTFCRQHPSPKFPDKASLQVTPVRLHAKFKTVAFSDAPGHVVEVSQAVVDKVSQLVADMMASVTLSGRLDNVGNLSKGALNIKSCVYAYLKNATTPVWTKEHPRFYACKTCANTQRPCMVAVGDVVFVLPLHPALRESEGEDEEMLDRLPVADSSANLNLWVSPTKNRSTSRVADVY